MAEENEKIGKRIMAHDMGLSFGQDVRYASSLDQLKEDDPLNPPRTSQWCYNLYNSAIACEDAIGRDAPRCTYLRSKAAAICPNDVADKFKEAVESGTWWGAQVGNLEQKRKAISAEAHKALNEGDQAAAERVITAFKASQRHFFNRQQ